MNTPTHISDTDAIEQAYQQVSTLKELSDMDFVIGVDGKMLVGMVRMYTKSGWVVSNCSWTLMGCRVPALFDIQPIMKECIALVRNLAEEKGIVQSMRVPAPGGVGTALVYLNSEGEWIFR